MALGCIAMITWEKNGIMNEVKTKKCIVVINSIRFVFAIIIFVLLEKTFTKLNS